MVGEVEHSQYGTGIALRERYAGGEFFVEFKNGLKFWVKKKDLFFLNQKDRPVQPDLIQKESAKPQKMVTFPIFSTHPSPNIHPTVICLIPGLSQEYQTQEKKEAVKPLSATKEKISEDIPHEDPQEAISETGYATVPDISPSAKISYDLESRIIIEALRMGGVPHNLADRFTAGRDDEIQQINSFFSDPNSSVILMEGEYGVGKSHMLALISSKALQNGWAVAKIEVDPKETAFHRPKSLYQALTRSFIYKKNGQVHNFFEFIRDIATQPNVHAVKKLFSHPYFKEVLIRWEENDDNFGLMEWIAGQGIEGQYSRMPKMHEAQTATNLYCNLISALGWAAKNVLHLEGVLILIDEAEGIDPMWYTAYQFGKATNFLKGITLMAKSDPNLRLEPYKHIYEQESPRSKVGKLTGLTYCGLDREILPFLWEGESHIKLMFSFIPHLLDSIIQIESTMPWFKELPRMTLDHIDENAMDTLYLKLSNIYSNAYQFSSAIDTREFLPKQKTRLYVKGIIESFDLLRYDKNTDFHEFVGL
jgi:hypothetical protein